jgi:hypothetical protein
MEKAASSAPVGPTVDQASELLKRTQYQLFSFDQCSLVGGEKFKRERNGRRETRAQFFFGLTLEAEATRE